VALSCGQRSEDGIYSVGHHAVVVNRYLHLLVISDERPDQGFGCHGGSYMGNINYDIQETGRFTNGNYETVGQGICHGISKIGISTGQIGDSATIKQFT
jgi:hypothetical protein